MYKKYRGLLVIKSPVYSLKNYLHPTLLDNDRETFIKNLLIKQLSNYKNKKIGYFVSLKDYSCLYIKVSPYDNNIVEVSCFFEAFFFRIEQNEILVAKVKEVTPTGLLLCVHNDSFLIEVSNNQISTEEGAYKKVGDANLYTLKNKTRIKEKDLVKLKVLNISAVPASEFKQNIKYKIKATCALRGLGKI